METQILQKRKLTKKERGFTKDFALTENGTQSALKNYDTKDYNTASVIASENLRKPHIQDAIEIQRKSLKEALYDAGITPQKIAEKVNVLLDSEKDMNAVNNGLKHATTIYGVEDPEKPKSGNTYNFIFTPEAQEKIRIVEAEIKTMLRKKKDA